MSHARATEGSSLIATGGDSVYFPLIDELYQSIRHAFAGRPPPFGVIDAGLTPEQCRHLRDAGAIVVRIPDDPALPRDALRKRPALAANFGKLWLDRLFPGSDVLIWLDADTWVQDLGAVRLLESAAWGGGLAITSGAGRYSEQPIEVRWLLGGLWGLAQIRSFNFKNGRHAGLPLAVLRDLGTRPLLNAGVFALRADAPHWEAMRRWQAVVLRRGKPFTSDQLAMALAIHRDGLKLTLLPEGCNYIQPWRFDPKVPALVEFHYPHARVGIVHLAGQKRTRFDPAATVPVLDLDDRPHQLSLRYGHFHEMARAMTPGVAAK